MEYIQIGTIINTHGIRGELKIRSFSDFDAQRYKKGNTVYIGNAQEKQAFTVDSFRSHKGFSLVGLKDMRDINLVEPFVGMDVFVDAADRAPLKKGEYYRSDLEGLLVTDEEGNAHGTVVDVEETLGAQNNLRIRLSSGREILMPYNKAFVRNIDLEKGEITVVWMEGLE